MRDMAHSICLIKLYQSTMGKNFNFLFLTTLKNNWPLFCEVFGNIYIIIIIVIALKNLPKPYKINRVFITFIHSMIHEIAKNLSLWGLHEIRSKGHTEKIKGFMFKILRVVRPLRNIFKSHETTEISLILKFSLQTSVVLFLHFPYQPEQCF